MRGFLSLLIPGTRDQHALAQTIADWRMERGSARTVLTKAFCDLRGIFSILRVIVLASALDFRSTEVWRFATFTCIAAMGLAAVQVVSAGWNGRLAVSEMLALIPACLVAGPTMLAGFGMGLKAERPFPALGAASMAFAVMVCLSGYVVPNSNQHFRELVGARVSPHTSARALDRGIPETTLTTLVRQTASDDWEVRQRARRVIALRAAVAAALPVTLLLGAAFRRTLVLKRWRVRQLAAGVLTNLVLIGGGLIGGLVQSWLPQPWLPVVRTGYESGPLWCAIAVCMVATILLSRRSNNDDSRAAAVLR